MQADRSRCIKIRRENEVKCSEVPVLLSQSFAIFTSPGWLFWQKCGRHCEVQLQKHQEEVVALLLVM